MGQFVSFSPTGSASPEAQSVLDYAETNHREALTAIATAVHVSDGSAEVGACLGSTEQFARGSPEAVSVPVGGSSRHPAVYVHTHPMMTWKPSEQDIKTTADRGDTARGFIVLTTNGLDSIFGSVVALPNEVCQQVQDMDGRYTLLDSLRKDNHFAKISSDAPPPTDGAAVKRGVDHGLLPADELND